MKFVYSYRLWHYLVIENIAKNGAHLNKIHLKIECQLDNNART